MSKLYFRYGTLNSSKTANALMVAHNYEEQNKKVLMFKPSIDTRSVKGLIESRVGIKHGCIDIDENFNFFNYINKLLINYKDFDCLIIDECQFLTSKQVKELRMVVDYFNIPVICYGLKNSYVENKLFEGSASLLYFADKIEEIKTVCVYCNKKATQNLRVLNGKPIYNGEVVNVGDVKEGDDYYVPVCNYHYYKPELI